MLCLSMYTGYNFSSVSVVIRKKKNGKKIIIHAVNTDWDFSRPGQKCALLLQQDKTPQ